MSLHFGVSSHRTVVMPAGHDRDVRLRGSAFEWGRLSSNVEWGRA